MSTISAGTATGTALVTSGDTSGQLVLQTNGTTTALTLGTDQSATFAGNTVTVLGNATSGAEIRLGEDTDNGSNYVAVKAPSSLAANLTFTLPSADGTNGQFLQTNGSGVLSFGTPAAGPMTLISSSSISAGSSEIIIPNLDFTTYKMYVVELIALASSSNNTIRVRMSTDNGSSFSSANYAYSYMVLSTAYSQSGTGGTPTDSFYLCSNPTVASNYTMDHTIRLYAPNGQYASISSASRLANTTTEQIQFSSGTNIGITSYNAIRIFPSAGTLSSGFVRVYAYT